MACDIVEHTSEPQELGVLFLRVQAEPRQWLPLLRRECSDAQRGYREGVAPEPEFRQSLSLTFGLVMLASENKSQNRWMAIPRVRPRCS